MYNILRKKKRNEKKKKMRKRKHIKKTAHNEWVIILDGKFVFYKECVYVYVTFAGRIERPK